MELEVYLHGNPRGFSYLGPADEKDSFFQRFYNRSKNVGKELIIERVQSYFYYTYLISKNVYDSNGRPNSYFGITVRFDSFYKNVASLFTLFDTLCNKWVVGSLLKEEYKNYQYTSNDLPKSVFENIQADLVDWIRRAISDVDLTNLQNFKASDNQIGQLNLIDCSFENVKKCLLNHNVISISPDFSLLRENEHEIKIQTLNHQWTEKWNDLQNKYTVAISDAQGLNGTIQTLKTQLSQTQNDLQRIQNEFKLYKTQNKLSYDIINGLKEEKTALLKLAGFVDSLGIEQAKTNNQRNRLKGEDNNERQENIDITDKPHLNIKRYLPYIFSAILLALIAWLLLSLKDCSKSLWRDDTPYADVVEQSDSTSGVSKETDSEKQSDQWTEELSAAGTSDEYDFNELTIDVEELTTNKKYMERGGAYNIRIYNKATHQPISVKGEWKINDSDFIIVDKNSSVTQITPSNCGDNMEIQFFVEGHDTPLKRTILVKEPN